MLFTAQETIAQILGYVLPLPIRIGDIIGLQYTVPAPQGAAPLRSLDPQIV